MKFLLNKIVIIKLLLLLLLLLNYYFFFNIGIIFEIKEFPFLLASRFLKSTVVQI